MGFLLAAAEYTRAERRQYKMQAVLTMQSAAARITQLPLAWTHVPSSVAVAMTRPLTQRRWKRWARWQADSGRQLVAWWMSPNLDCSLA